MTSETRIAYGSRVRRQGRSRPCSRYQARSASSTGTSLLQNAGVIAELDRAAIDDLLRSQVVGRIGCHADGQTYVVPVIYAYDGEGFYAYSLEGRKIRMMRANPRVCFEVDEYDGRGSWRSAIVQGTFEELAGADAERALALLSERFAEPLSERGDRRGRGGLHHELRVRHRPDDVLEDGLVGHRDELVHEAADELEGVLADALHAQPVDDRVAALEGDPLTRLDARLHRGPIGRLDADDPDR